jgi:translation initiation factor 3 subunit L
MAGQQQRMPLWAAEAQIDEDMQDVDLNMAIGNYGQNVHDQGAFVLPPIILF